MGAFSCFSLSLKNRFSALLRLSVSIHQKIRSVLWHAVDFVGMLSVFFTTFRWARAFVHSLRPNEEMKKTDGKSAKPPFNFG